MFCAGLADDHCCYFGEPCEHIEENTVPGRRWACGLYRVHGSWEAVYQAPEYQSVREKLTQFGIVVDCGDWPPPGERCNTCGGING